MTTGEVLTATADVTQCSANGIAGRAKSGMVVHCRRVYAVACKLLGFGCRDTATTIGRDHSTICYLWKAATDADGQLARQVVRKVLNETRATPRAMAMKPRYGVAVSPGCMDDPAWRALKARANQRFHVRFQEQEADDARQPNRQDDGGERPGLQLARGRQHGGSGAGAADAPTAGAA